MEVGQAQVVRRDWYDRNLESQGQRYSGILAPHGATLQIDYAVPANRKMVVNSLMLGIYRVTAAGALDHASAIVSIYRGVTFEGDIAEARLYDNTIGSIASENISPQQILNTGDRLVITSRDNGTGGTLAFNLAFTGTLFDA